MQNKDAGPLFKKYSEFQESNSRAFKQAQALLKLQTSCLAANPELGQNPVLGTC